jgi:hypothetical protein
MSSMLQAMPAEEYRVPKREISAEAVFLGHPRKVVHLFLSERAQSHDGAESLIDLLNGPGDFLPAVEPPRSLILLHKDALMALSVAVETDLPSQEPAEGEDSRKLGTSLAVSIALRDGTEIGGMVHFVMPEGRNRLVDFLNEPEPFFAVKDGARSHLVNKRCIAHISLVGQEPGK